ncbi:MAG TPA: M14 family zinc carboxypeptidase, partial [Bacteroidales bacterium]|nr:M14 family zinc carboxypeptidase [Bacteroidales bacterium]
MRNVILFLHAVLLTWLAMPMQAQVEPDLRSDSLLRVDGEVYFLFRIQDADEIHSLTRIISIDKVEGEWVHAYANRQQFKTFLKRNYAYTILPHPARNITMSSPGSPSGTGAGTRTVWNFYPTYEDYFSYMHAFAADYPAICRLDTVGVTIQGRLILVVKISANIGQEEAEPQFLYTSSIHGDETTGYILMMHLIDYLLSGYGTDPAITELVNTTEICINPLANPDGTYHGGNSSVSGSVRYNANSIDLNRNFPDPKMGPHPDGQAWQPETVAWMDYADANHFNMSANFHGGSEVFNYPWDTWPRLHADDDWWQFTGREW